MSLVCPRSKSLVQYSKKQRKSELRKKQFFWICFRTINLIPLWKQFFWNCSFAITKQLLIPKWKNWGINKSFALQTQKLHHEAFLFCLPPCDPLDPGKNIFFHPTTFAPCYKTISQKNGWQCPPLDLFVCRSTHGQLASSKKVARSGGLTTNVNNNTMKLPNNTNKNQNFLLTHQKHQR